jgi:hypothetical protein
MIRVSLMLFIVTLVVYRLARLIAIDEGPFLLPNKAGSGFFLFLRTKLGAYDNGENGLPKTGIGRGISCPHCVGLWVALPLAFIVDISWLTPLYWLAIAGAQSVLWKER